MPTLNWGLIQDGGAFESLMHAVLYAEDPSTILFGRLGKDAGQDGRTADGTTIYQAKYRQNLDMDGAVRLALEELEKIRTYSQPAHVNHRHWENARRWILVANFSINPNDDEKWQSQVVRAFREERLEAAYWSIEILESKLAQHPEVLDVFFGGENRVLVSLKEAHDLLVAESVGSASFDVPMTGRDSELDRIKAFAMAGGKRVLPVIGPGGIGKSRLLYEGLVSLAQDGWRVLWGLPGAMTRSSQWFRLLNGPQQTCVALDDPDDPGLLRAVVEQLAAVERRNWCVIIACRNENAEALRRYRTHSSVDVPVKIDPLEEQTANTLMNACLGSQADPPWLHAIYGLTHGVPGWICLIAELAKRNALHELPQSADGIAAIYVESCLGSLEAPSLVQGRTLLRWMALWGTLRIEPWDSERNEIRFLETQGVPERTILDLLRRFVGAGIVRNWGVGKRLYAVEPLIVRHQILSSWLLRENAGRYEVSAEGKTLVSLLVRGEVPAADAALDTLSHLARFRLTEPEAVLFMGPVFRAMAAIAREGNVLDQYSVADLVQKSGVADPESALDVLVEIRQNVKERMEKDIPPWGPQSFTHSSLVAKLPWTLFQIAEYVSCPIVARRYIEEFRQLVALEDLGTLRAERGKEPRQLLKRILCESDNSEVYAQPAHDLVVAELTIPTSWPFVGLMTECLLNPIRETINWVANWTITFTRRAFLPESLEWNLAVDIKEEAFNALRSNTQPEFRGPLWKVLAESHHSFHRVVLHDQVSGTAASQYHAVLVDDLKKCASILGAPPIPLSMEEATKARDMWAWYLKFGQDDDLRELSRRCELIYNSLSTWRLHDFFHFGSEEDLAPETARVAGMLRSASSPDLFTEFFDEAKRYLDAVRQGSEDSADDWRISSLAEACADLPFEVSAPANALTAFAIEVLEQPEPMNPLAWTFVVRVCRHHLLFAKANGDAVFEAWLARLLDATEAKSRLLWGLYCNVHPASIGTLTSAELRFIFAHEAGFSGPEWFYLLGAFNAVDQREVHIRLRGRLDALRDDPIEASRCMAYFIKASYLAALRYKWAPTLFPTSWVIDIIIGFNLDGKLLSMHELEWLRDNANFRLNMAQLAALVHSRIELEQRPKPGINFKILPHDFAIGKWCSFDLSNPAEVDAFQALCRMALGPSFTANYWLPKYIAQIDPTGEQVAIFVQQYLSGNPDMSGDALARLGYLASAYKNDSAAWEMIARPICERAQLLRREEREHVYFGLSRKETGVIQSVPGQVAEYYLLTRDIAARLLALEPPQSHLKLYREWSLRRAEEDLQRAEERAEETANG